MAATTEIMMHSLTAQDDCEHCKIMWAEWHMTIRQPHATDNYALCDACVAELFLVIRKQRFAGTQA